MADDSDASSFASTPAPVSPSIPPPDSMTEEDKRMLIAALDGYKMETEEDQRLLEMGSLDTPAVLEDMMAARRWLDVAAYLQRALSYHREAAQAAVAYPDGDDPPLPNDMARAHPELFVLPRRQHVLELLRIGDMEEAQKYFNEGILEPLRFSNRTHHLHTLITELQGITFSDEAAAQLNLPEERRRTSQHIRDYLRVYFPTLKRSAEAAESMAISKKELYTAWPFGEQLSEHNYRCLLCHQTIALVSARDNRMVEHFHCYCPAIMPGILRRLPNPNRPTWQRHPPKPQPPPPPPPPPAAAADLQQQEANDE